RSERHRTPEGTERARAGEHTPEGAVDVAVEPVRRRRRTAERALQAGRVADDLDADRPGRHRLAPVVQRREQLGAAEELSGCHVAHGVGANSEVSESGVPEPFGLDVSEGSELVLVAGPEK